LFLTTIGVYLGLVLVGGTAPQVFAHSATTRNFEISEEIEVKDDLDKQPDRESANAALSLEVYFQDVEFFLRNLQRLREDGKFDLAHDSFEVAQSTLLPCVPANQVGSYTAKTFKNENDTLRPWLKSFSERLTDGYSLADCLPSRRFEGKEATESRFNFKLDDFAFKVEVAVRKQSPDAARVLNNELKNLFKSAASNDLNVIHKQLRDKTSFISKNDQVMVITRLPRAALDSLLATNAK
jgi:hypothetical protein